MVIDPTRGHRHVVVRADASSTIGTGHIFRCLGLADELSVRGYRLTFATQRGVGHLQNLIATRGYGCITIPDDASVEEDARATLSVLGQLDAVVRWIIVDHYGLDYRWEQLVRSAVPNIFVIDDLADRRHDADVLLDSVHLDDRVYREP